MNKDKEILEKVYSKPMAVWTNPNPPKELMDLIETGKIKPCKVLDPGCGEGFYSIYLAKKGFEVTGVDISERAIEYAKKNAAKAGVKIKFLAMNAVDLAQLDEKFDFVFEWALMHLIMPDQREKYVQSIDKLLNKGGHYFSVCFNNQGLHFDKPGKKLRILKENTKAPGMRLYFTPMQELKELFVPYFTILKERLIKMTAGPKVHIGNYLLMRKG